MPACITHELIARAALKELPACTRRLIGRHADCYLLGAQGPDLYFFYRPLSPQGNLGKYLHRNRVGDWFGGMLTALDRYTGDDFGDCLAYALGFCTHLSADALFHPVVYRILREKNLPKNKHQEIENDWDVYFSARRHQSARGYVFPYSPIKIARRGSVYPFAAHAARAVGKSLGEASFHAMCALFERYLKVFHTGGPRLLRPFFPTLYPNDTPEKERIGGKEFYAFSEGRAGDCDELFSAAAKDSVKRIEDFLRAFNADMVLSDELFSVHMLTGERLYDSESLALENTQPQ